MKLSNRKINALAQAIVALDAGTTHLVALGNGEKTAAQIPHKLGFQTRWTLTKNLEAVRPHSKAYSEARQAKVREVSGGKEEIDGKKEPEKFAAFTREEEALLEKAPDVKGLIRIKLSELRGKEGEENVISPLILEGLRPILNDDTPAAAEADKIA